MSPHAVNNFVTDLVAMAKAMEELPLVQEALRHSNQQLDGALERVANREQTILDLKAEVEQHLSSIRSLEVARDDAELRFLEADEKAQIVVRRLGAVLDSFMDTQAEVTTLVATLSPPKPEPVAPQAPTLQETSIAYTPPQAMGSTTEIHGQPIGGNGNGDPSSCQSEPDPTPPNTVDGTNTVQESASSVSVGSQEGVASTNHPSISGPYAGLRYYDHHSWVSLEDWLAGGGTEANYDWRPEGSHSF